MLFHPASPLSITNPMNPLSPMNPMHHQEAPATTVAAVAKAREVVEPVLVNTPQNLMSGEYILTITGAAVVFLLVTTLACIQTR